MFTDVIPSIYYDSTVSQCNPLSWKLSNNICSTFDTNPLICKIVLFFNLVLSKMSHSDPLCLSGLVLYTYLLYMSNNKSHQDYTVAPRSSAADTTRVLQSLNYACSCMFCTSCHFENGHRFGESLPSAQSWRAKLAVLLQILANQLCWLCSMRFQGLGQC